jgi:proteasome lid subunit RPN8/RPN11
LGVIVLPPNVLEILEMEVEKAYPREACGFLLGEIQDDNLILLSIIPGQTGSVDRYLLSAEDLNSAEGIAFLSAQSVLGFYHSHPDGKAWPSKKDLEDALPGYVYAILASVEKRVQEIAFFKFDENTGLLAPISSP